MKYQYFKTTLLILTGFMLYGCGEEPKTAIIGSWQGVSLQQDITFLTDGSAQLTDRKHGVYEGHCFINNGDQLSCKFDRFSFPVERTVKISGDKLHLINKSGQEEVYRRL